MAKITILPGIVQQFDLVTQDEIATGGTLPDLENQVEQNTGDIFLLQEEVDDLEAGFYKLLEEAGDPVWVPVHAKTDDLNVLQEQLGANTASLRDSINSVEAKVAALESSGGSGFAGLPFAVWQTSDEQGAINNGVDAIKFGDGAAAAGDGDTGLTLSTEGVLTNTSGSVKVVDVRYNFLINKAGHDAHVLAWIRHSAHPGTGNESGEPRFGLTQTSKLDVPMVLAGAGTVTLQPNESISIRMYNGRTVNHSGFRTGYAAQLTAVILN